MEANGKPAMVINTGNVVRTPDGTGKVTRIVDQLIRVRIFESGTLSWFYYKEITKF